MIIEELLHASPPVDVARLRAQQDRELEARNQANLERYTEDAFGPFARMMLAPWPIPPTAVEIEAMRQP